MAWVLVQGIPFSGGHPDQGLPPGYGGYPSTGPIWPGSPGYPSTGPIYPGGHPGHGLPIGPGHPSTGPIYPGGHPGQGLPISPGYPSTGPIIPGITPHGYPAVTEAQIGDHPDKPDPTKPGAWVLISVAPYKVEWAWVPVEPVKPPEIPQPKR